MSARAADDFDTIRTRRDELRRERGYIEIAGPAGNPTQPGHPCPDGISWCVGPYILSQSHIQCTACITKRNQMSAAPAFCGNCGTDLAHGMPHAATCPKAVFPAVTPTIQQDYDYGCDLSDSFGVGSMQARLVAFAARIRAVLAELTPAE